jgi:hypothetical protein
MHNPCAKWCYLNLFIFTETNQNKKSNRKINSKHNKEKKIEDRSECLREEGRA